MEIFAYIEYAFFDARQAISWDKRLNIESACAQVLQPDQGRFRMYFHLLYHAPALIVIAALTRNSGRQKYAPPLHKIS